MKSSPENQQLVLILTSFANASFTRLFGGDSISMLIVFIATLVGYRIKQIMLENRMDIRLIFFCSAFFPSVIAASGHLFSLGETPQITLGTSVLYLIPGIPYINSRVKKKTRLVYVINNSDSLKNRSVFFIILCF
ncbi:threonine/serine exporter family protein [Massilibacteroides vaginae]|uniref:threonine/serine exporter family protein n=1 Tax=Massilibacteroides vaginae TaxID=1673718 RepID=UPI001FE9EA48